MKAVQGMPTYIDAIGYLKDLAKEVDEQWFSMVCDLAAVCGVSVLDKPRTETLFALYTKNGSYIGIKPVTAAVAAATPGTPADFLHELSGFTNFKLLGSSLGVLFKKRITLIFGANGSGKSSLCESLKVLASPESPNRPLQNVRAASGATSAFHYKFKSDAAQQTWTTAVGYGPRRTTIKYFDTAIAIKNVKNAVEPGRVIVLTPFKLHVFEWTKALTTQFREELQKAQQNNTKILTQMLETIRTEFVMYKGRPLAAIDEKTVTVLQAEIKLGEGFTDEKLLSQKQTAAAELEKATSEEGLKLLRAEHRDLDAFLASLGMLLTSAANLWELEPVSKAKALAAKQGEQAVLAKALIPKDGTLQDFLALLRAASVLCEMDKVSGHACPLCKRDFDVSQVELFKRYHDLLAGELENEITALKGDIARAGEYATAVGDVDRNEWEKSTTLKTEFLTAAKTGSDIIIASCEVSKIPTAEARAALKLLKASSATWAEQLELKKKAIEAADRGREELIKQLTKLRAEAEPMEYAQAIKERLEKLKETKGMATQATFWNEMLPAFTPLLRKITDKAKEAHEELVVVDFEARLNAEYKTLTEKDMAAFGVMLARKGTDATVTVLPQIGGKDIDGVLSEGEQRVHALALFFAELETCSQSVLVFDDPISSFDYNYIANYCIRLRDFALTHPTRQIIIFTHNWEFFVQIQSTLNAGGPDGCLSVQVLENCAAVAEYSEKVHELMTDIEAVLQLPSEPTKSQKEMMAGKMRRLIESVVNTHVFNKQRHQYKQKSLMISEFHQFAKLVPLLPTEATALRDLYAMLSISEHDNPQNAYVNTDKATFQIRYDSIKAIEAAIIARK
jgi:recombinational DNA repair ATPase RecF